MVLIVLYLSRTGTNLLELCVIDPKRVWRIEAWLW